MSNQNVSSMFKFRKVFVNTPWEGIQPLSKVAIRARLFQLDPECKDWMLAIHPVITFMIRDWLHKNQPSDESVDKMLLIASLSCRMRNEKQLHESDIRNAIRNVGRFNSVSDLQVHRAFCLDLVYSNTS